MSVNDSKEIYHQWVKAWNEDVSLLDEIATADCTVHQARTDGKYSYEQIGPEALKGIITDGKAFFTDVKMDLEVGPITDGNYVSARWKFTGIYDGNMPGAQAESGKKISFYGMDLFLIEDGKIQEYWVSSDGVDLMGQLGIFK
ncbi:SnoaL-like polyketide cyclase [Lentibacillus halodurans]|uniref:SnoaL-like polyketide cyclase n=1 Tax=Lentibacillus halodurans TaxID=237679 RepID=A0A1I0X0Z9_9BACI|nr:ester cyclase [Lentibacillus halodurans]SFA94665.1 SnoaL-like polyketide cyclase [Lentibacillus halodurans]